MVSKAALEIKQGANVSFDWYASDDEDAYDVYGYLLEVRKHQANIICDHCSPPGSRHAAL